MKLKRYTHISLISTALLFLTVIVLGITNTISRVSDNRGKETSGTPAKFPEGNLFLSDFYFSNFAHLQIWSIAQDTSETMLYATQRGIISFDGTTENFLSISAIPYKVAVHPTTGKIYVACENGFGRLDRNSNGQYNYISLSDTSSQSASYSDIIFTEDKICFVGDERITTLGTDESAPTSYSGGKSGFDSWLLVENKLLVKSEGRFLNPKTPADVFPFLDNTLAEKSIRSFVVMGELTMAVTTDNKFYKIQKQTVTEFVVESQKYFDESVITGAYVIDKKQFAVSTLNGGVLILDSQTGKTNYTINYRTGLPDDEIFALGGDSKGGLWIAHSFGISRADLLLPIRDFTHYPGIEGRINALQISDSVLYAATGEGVYYLTEIKDIDEIQELVERSENQKQVQNSPVRNEPEQITPVVTPDNSETNTETETDDGVLDRWRNKWKNRKKDKDSDEKGSETETNSEPKTEPETTTPEVGNNTTRETELVVNEPKKVYVKRKKTPKKDVRREYELQSVKYAFKKVEGLNSKAVKLIKTSVGLFAITNDGLYQISDFKAIRVSELAVNDMFEGKKQIYVATSDGIYLIENKNKITLTPFADTKGKIMYSVAELNGKLWSGGQNTAYSHTTAGTNSKTFTFKTEFPEAIMVHIVEKDAFFFTDEAVFEFDASAESMKPAEMFKSVVSYKSRFNFPSFKSVIISEQGAIHSTYGCEDYENNLKYVNLILDFMTVVFLEDAIWSVSKSNKILCANKKGIINVKNLQLHIESVIQGDSLNLKYSADEIIKLSYDYNKLSVKLSAPSFLVQSGVSYFYVLDNETGATEINGNTLTLPELSYGAHEIRFFAKNSLHEESEPAVVRVEINAPFWYSAIFWVLVGIVGAALGGLIAMLLNRRKNMRMQRLNEELEAEVLRRTQKIQEQNAEIKAQNDEILDQNKKIAEQNKQISKQHEEITDSIRYASRIQSAVLPSVDILTKHLAGAFIFFNPRDIVSGDFYWFDKIEDEIFIAAADCTGHGVPGGFLSMLGISFLNEIVSEKTIRTGEILDKLRDKVIKSLNQSKDSDAKDGMDIAFVKINTTTLQMEFAGANNLIFLIRDGVLDQIKPDRMPVGYHREAKKHFTTNEIKLQKGDLIYLFSDGYVDQFSEATKRKFSKARLQELLLEIRNLKMDDQLQIVEAMFHKWKGEYIQIDDILIIGLKV